MKAVLFFMIKTFLLVVLPFICLIRGAVYFHKTYEWYPSMAILGGGIITLVLLVIYITWFYGRFTGRLGNKESFKFRLFLAGILILVYCGHGLFFFKSDHAKSEGVRKEFTNLHPVLRLSISTLLFVDSDLILTDASRLPEDYKKMGLKTKRHSLHYKQSNGYAHAFDVRTKGHSELRNNMIQWYFSLMGLNTLRHGGTGDHLHVSLLSHDRPGAI